MYFYTLGHVLLPLKAAADLGRNTRREELHFCALYCTKCDSVLILCHHQHKSTVMLSAVAGGVRDECPFRFKISSCGV